VKFLDMQLTNFRQFYGNQSLEFAGVSSERNITVVHGFNGAGKTALLNAFTWCLYGATTPDLEASDRLENERARDEASTGEEVVVSVTIRFEMHDEGYRITRSRRSTKGGTSELTHPKDSLELLKIDNSGELVPITGSDDIRQKRIEQFLPRALYPFFFFNGERVERLAAPDAYDKVELGVKTLLDIAVYERGAYHLRGQAARTLAKELRNHGDDELKRALDSVEVLEKEKEGLEEEQTLYSDNVSAVADEIDAAEKQQADLKDLYELTERRREHRDDLSGVLGRIKEAQRELTRAISKDGFLAFADPVMNVTRELIGAARQRGEIPAKIKPQFVDDLLQRAMCICKRPLEPGTVEAGVLQEWRKATGLADLEEKINYTGTDIARLEERQKSLFETHDETQARLGRLYRERTTLKDELAAIDEKLGDREFGDDAAALQERIQSLRLQHNDHSANSIVCERSLQENEETRAAALREIEKLKVKGEEAQLIKCQLEAVERVADAFDEVARIQADDVRRSLDAQIGEIWRDAAIKDYEASITSTYQLLLTKSVAGQTQPVVGASTGEKQVLALSFVGSLVKKARENASMVHGVHVGGHYPLVMDSPFGSLEDTYRRKVAQWVPSLADQVIVMVSRSQWRHEVEDAMRERVGKAYVLELHTPKSGADQRIELNGADFDYVVSTNDPTEQTIIRRVIE
jgi:DNA sulfur modification protein DndD